MRELGRVALGPALALAAIALAGVVLWWLHRRDQRRLEVQQQLRDMEQAIYEETLPEHEREWRRQYRAQQAEIRREARRRLGLPEEAPPC
jgi:uncharacterized protein HemX